MAPCATVFAASRQPLRSRPRQLPCAYVTTASAPHALRHRNRTGQGARHRRPAFDVIQDADDVLAGDTRLDRLRSRRATQVVRAKGRFSRQTASLEIWARAPRKRRVVANLHVRTFVPQPVA